jgi:hypothetical protein
VDLQEATGNWMELYREFEQSLSDEDFLQIMQEIESDCDAAIAGKFADLNEKER